MTVYATRDADGVYIHQDARIRPFRTAAEAEEWLLDAYPITVPGERPVFKIGEFGDCWIKLHSIKDLSVWQFSREQLNIQAPGTHPGGRMWWVTPRPPVLVVTFQKED